jgi:hypothetical protein
VSAAAAPVAGKQRAASGAPGLSMTPEQVVTEIYNRFMAQKIRSMTYDEVRVIAYESNSPGSEGLTPLNEANGATYLARYFYQAPARHGYRSLTNPIKNYWIGSPNQPGALPMDERWKDKVISWFNIYKSPQQAYRGRKAAAVTLVPKPSAPKNLYPMTWLVDPDKFIVIKFIFLVEGKDNSTVSTTGEMYYKNINGYLLPSSSKWSTRASTLPYLFKQKSAFKNYHINIPLDDSVFKEEFPENWFENLNQKPIAQ